MEVISGFHSEFPKTMHFELWMDHSFDRWLESPLYCVFQREKKGLKTVVACRDLCALRKSADKNL